MKNKIGRIKRGIAVVLSIITMFSVLSFSGGRYLQTSLQAFAAAETEAVVIKPTYTVKFDKENYNKLLKQLNAYLQKKKFSKLAKRFLRDLLKYEVRNYPLWKTVNRDYPLMYKYVKENLVDVIPYISKIKLIDKSTPKGKACAKKVSWVGQTSQSETGCTITMFYDISNPNMSDYEYAEVLATLAHEIRHVRDRKAILHTEFPTRAVDDIFIEGGASFFERHCLPMVTHQESWDTVTTSKGVTLYYDREDGCGYPYFQCIYDGLIYLAGYRAVDAVGKGKSVLSVKNAIAERYGQKVADEIWRLLLKLPRDPEKSKKPDTTFLTTVKFFRNMLNCVKQDIRNLDVSDKKQVRKYMDIFRNLKVKILPHIQDDDGILTDTYFAMDAVEEKLIDQVIASKALPQIFENRTLNRQAVKEMLYYSETEYPVLLFNTEYLPPTIAQTAYTFSFDGYYGNMQMVYTDADGDHIQFDCPFDEESFYKRECSYVGS